MTRVEVIQKALEGKITWIQAADILRVSYRHMFRIRMDYEKHGLPGVRDGRHQPRAPRIPQETVDELCRLRRELYPDFSIRHFYEFATEKHGLHVSYTFTRTVLQSEGLAEKAPGRGKYRRKRERRPMRGMMLHMDGSTHEWIRGLPMWDLIVVLDDADGRMLYARFFPEEGTLSTMAALRHVLERHGRFSELYTDRGSHFQPTLPAGSDPKDGQVGRALRALGIRQILAHSPQARGRSERAFGTVQGRLPQELRVAGIKTYEAANDYLERVFLPDFNRRFTVKPAQTESAFTPLAGIDIELLFTAQHDRVVRQDNTVSFDGIVLQIPRRPDRVHFARCPVIVHVFPDESLAVSFQGSLLGRYTATGELVLPSKQKKKHVA